VEATLHRGDRHAFVGKASSYILNSLYGVHRRGPTR